MGNRMEMEVRKEDGKESKEGEGVEGERRLRSLGGVGIKICLN